MKFLSGRVIFDLFLLAGAALGLWQAQVLPETRGISQIDPGDFPTAVCAIAILALLVVLFQDLKRPPAESETRFKLKQLAAISAVAVLLAAYIWSLSLVGFFVATSAFLFVTTLVCARVLSPDGVEINWPRTAVIAVAVAVASTAIAYLVFSMGFGLMFP